MERSTRTQSRLLLRLALALGDCKIPTPTAGRRSSAAISGETPREAGAEEQEHARDVEPEALSEAAWQRLQSLNLRFESELAYADSCLAEDPPSSRVEILLANSTELRKVAILQRFLERAYSCRLEHPREGLRISDDLIAWTKGDPSPLGAVIRGRAWIERGNCLRILGEPPAACAALAEAARELEVNGTGDPLELARYQEVLGTLERDCGNFASGADILRRAVSKFRRWGDNYTLQRALVSLGLTELYNNNFEAADAALKEAVNITEPDSLLLRYAGVNRVLVCYYSGRPAKAYQALSRMREGLGASWLRGFPIANQMSVLWSEGRIRNTLRPDDEAIGCLKTAREFYIQENRGGQVCHVSVELALGHVIRERFAEARRELALGLSFSSEKRPFDQSARRGRSALARKTPTPGSPATRAAPSRDPPAGRSPPSTAPGPEPGPVRRPPALAPHAGGSCPPPDSSACRPAGSPTSSAAQAHPAPFSPVAPPSAARPCRRNPRPLSTPGPRGPGRQLFQRHRSSLTAKAASTNPPWTCSRVEHSSGSPPGAEISPVGPSGLGLAGSPFVSGRCTCVRPLYPRAAGPQGNPFGARCARP